MPNPVLPPTPDILKINNLLDNVLTSFTEAMRSKKPLGKFEADIEALHMLIIDIRNVEGVTTLAGSDLVLLPAAISMARSAFEIGIRLRWMIEPQDPFEREIRWLAHIKEHESYHSRIQRLGFRSNTSRSRLSRTPFLISPLPNTREEVSFLVISSG